MISIREERPEDVPAVRAVNEMAFPEPVEADIVDKIRAACRETLSLVAADGDTIVGHIFFSPVNVTEDHGSLQGMGLGPMAVVPERQRQGIGSQLVEAGLREMRARQCPFVIVLGHPEYYPRFGFRPASGFGLSCQWDGIPDDVFMVFVLDESALTRVSGVVRYRDEFDEAGA